MFIGGIDSPRLCYSCLILDKNVQIEERRGLKIYGRGFEGRHQKHILIIMAVNNLSIPNYENYVFLTKIIMLIV